MSDYASLIQSESGGNWQAQNNVQGSGGAGHFGRLQFSRGRLADAMRAGAIPQGTTPEQFMANPALQQAAEAWHFSDIDNFIDQNNLSRFEGQSIGGVPVTREGLRAVAHLGGSGGMRRFLESGGQYNPSDAYGTSLMDYLGRHGGGGGSPVATRGQSMPSQQGLLAMMGGQQPQQQAAQPSRWDRAPMGLSDPDRRARLAMALEGMTLNPNQQLMQGLRDDVTGRREDARTAQARNATAEWLRSQGRDDLASVVEGGGLQGAQAMQLAIDEAARQRARSAPPAAIADVEARANYLGLQGEERDAFLRRELGAGPPQIDPTDDIREYQFAVGQGFQGTFTDYMEQQAAARRNQTNVNVNSGETAFSRVAGERAATQLGTVLQTGVQAQRSLALIDDLEGNLQAGGAGATAPLRLMAGQFGVVTDGLSDLQAAEAIVNRMIPMQREPGSGPMSDRDVEMYARSLPRIANQPGGNALIIQTMRQVLEYDVAAGMIAQSALAGEISPQEANARMMQLTDPLSQVRPLMTGGGASPTPQPSQAGQAFDFANPQAGAVLDGYRFLGGDPTRQSSWERM